MASLDYNESAKLELKPQDTLRVTVSGGSASVTGLSGAPAGTTVVTGTRDFGPYNTPAVLRVLCTAGRVDYGVVDTSGAGAVSGGGNSAGIYGFTLANTRRLRAALARVYAGTGRAKIGLIGDSTMVGEGSTAAGATNCVAKAFPAKLAALLSARGLPCVSTAVFGDGGSSRWSLAPGTQDPRLSLGANWTNGQTNFGATGAFGLGGSYLGHINAATDALAFTPGAVFDSIDVYTYTFPTNGTATVNVDGGSSLGTINTGVGTVVGFQKSSFTCARAAHTLNMVPSSAASIPWAGFDVWDSTTPAVSLLNFSHRGSVVSDFVTGNVGGLNALALLPTVACDAYIVDLIVNDAAHLGNWSSASQYQTYLQTMVSTLLPLGDVIFRFGAPSLLTYNASTADVSAYVAAAQAVIAANSLPVLDLRTRWGNAEISTSYYFNGLHPSGPGYADEAQQAAAALLAL